MNPAFVYLDQSDWSYLQQGKFPVAERQLKMLGASGRAFFLVTVHHLEETAGLNRPLDRINYMRDFPGTHFVDGTLGSDLVGREAGALVGASEAEGASFSLVPMAEVPETTFVEYLDGLRPGRNWRRLLEPVYAQNRELYLLDTEVWKATRRPTPKEELALWRNHFRGEIEAAIVNIENVRGSVVEHDARARIATKIRTCAKTWQAGAEAGLLPPSDLDFDRVFAMGVYPRIPMPYRLDKERVARAVVEWEGVAKKATPLSCCAHVATAVFCNMNRKYSASDQVDALHAAFAPLVTISTADKRTVDLLQRLGLKNMIKSHRLDDVAERLGPAPGA